MCRERKRLGIASFTARGKSVADRLDAAFREEYEISRYECGLRSWCGAQFSSGADGIIFVGACGIAVRSVAPFLKSKTTDPAVLVVDEAGQFVISLLSGHIGGANRLAIRAAKILDATPVITTATDVNGKFAADVFAKDNGLRIGSMKAAKEISAAILRGERVRFCCEGEIEGIIPPELLLQEGEAQPGVDPVHAVIRVGAFSDGFWPEDSTVLTLFPKAYILGIGCRKGKSEQEIAHLADQSLAGLHLSYKDVAGVASIDLKKEESGLLEFSKRRNLRFETYPAETLAAVRGAVSRSAFVSEVTGVDNVCERAALCMAGEGGRLLLTKQAENGVTAAIAEQKWSVKF